MGSTVAVSESPRDPDRLLASAGVRGDPNRDQHFLIDDRVLDRIVDYGQELPGPFERVLEIGAGPGALTDRLLRSATNVHAVELDRNLVRFLEDEFSEVIAADRLEVIHGDALEVDIPRVDSVVANLPYSAASEIIFRLLPERIPMVVTVQREFAQRLVAPEGTADYGRLTVSAWWYAEVELLEVVPSTAFEPAPPVESAVVSFIPVHQRADLDGALFARVVKAVFTQRRKTMRNAIRNTTHISGIEDSEAVLEGLDEELLRRRPDAVSPAEYVEIVSTVTATQSQS